MHINLNTDINKILKLRDKQSSQLSDFSCSIASNFFTENVFRINTVNSKIFILLLAQKKPLSFVSGSPIRLEQVLKEYNRNEFHHLYPRAYLNTLNEGKNRINCLANFCFLSRADNIKLGGDKPSIYKGKITGDIDEILKRSISPQSLFHDDFDTFLDERADMLKKEAKKLVG